MPLSANLPVLCTCSGARASFQVPGAFIQMPPQKSALFPQWLVSDPIDYLPHIIFPFLFSSLSNLLYFCIYCLFNSSLPVTSGPSYSTCKTQCLLQVALRRRVQRLQSRHRCRISTLASSQHLNVTTWSGIRIRRKFGICTWFETAHSRRQWNSSNMNADSIGGD